MFFKELFFTKYECTQTYYNKHARCTHCARSMLTNAGHVQCAQASKSNIYGSKFIVNKQFMCYSCLCKPVHTCARPVLVNVRQVQCAQASKSNYIVYS